MGKIACTYCGTLNDTGEIECIGCGAPLASALTTQIVLDPSPIEIQPIENPGQSYILDQVPSMLREASTVVGIVWRTLGESLAIALVAFGLGVIGAITNTVLLAGLGAILVGVAVGLMEKNFWLVLIGAPLGALAGFVVGVFLLAIGAGSSWLVLTISVGAILGAVIGGHRRPARRDWWEKLRPLFGSLWALLFVLLGLLLGAALWQIARLILGRI